MGYRSTHNITFQLDDSRFIARPLPGGSPRYVNLECQHEPSESFPVTCFAAHKNQIINAQVLNTWRDETVDNDDVFYPAFLDEIIFSGVSESDVVITRDAQRLLSDWDIVKISFQPNLHLRDGPYYLDRENGNLYSVWRVYEDHQLAFLQALWPSLEHPGHMVPADTAGNGSRGHGIAVPAQSYSYSTTKASAGRGGGVLSGLRVAVQDNFHIKGTKTSLGNRAFFYKYSEQRTTADVVVRLQEAGASIVGKTHLCSFAMKEHPMQSVDYQAPFNPRGDGYQITGGSSGGSAAAIAAYEWVDIAICSDTMGNARISALQTGIFGFRPSTNSISCRGLVESCPAFDTPAWFGRDLSLFPDVLQVLQPNSAAPASLKGKDKHIFYLRDFAPQDVDTHYNQIRAMNDFIGDIAAAPGSTWSSISIHDDWKATAPVEEKDLQKYLYNTTRHGWLYSAYHSFDKFREDYQQSLGRAPVVTEAARRALDMGKEVPPQDNQDIMHRFSVFKDWFTTRYFSSEDHDSLMVLHIDTVEPRYRDEYPGNDNPEVSGLRATDLSAILGAPELALPISEIEYHSRVTGKEEKLPMVVGLMGAPGTDMELIGWAVDAIRESDRKIIVKTGETAF